ncbi:hypothetical protein PanWU01x14_114890 [Parasponia andersonii]|uniref:Uncharacterized protein n=1 Tax=Parasponia andersonii TaxID=3476 RepID=A0A2P5CXI5_PARAD|nr:hypothetical protein PanWU01x14_114890 [Parasponia andersonii]
MQEKKKRSNIFQPLAICRRLFSFVMDYLIPRGLKRVITTSHSLRQGSTPVPMVSAKANVKRVEFQQAHYKLTEDLGSWTRAPAQMQERKEERNMFVGSNSDNNNNKTVSSFEEEERVRKMKGKSVSVGISSSSSSSSSGSSSSENLRPVVEAEEVKLPNRPVRQRQVRPLFDVAVNINEKSDAFIRSRKEAMRRNYVSSEVESTY